MDNVQPLTYDLQAEMMIADSLSERARTALIAIANPCPLEGGDAVYQALAILEPALYADAETCIPLEEREEHRSQHHLTNEAGISVCSNPSSGRLTLISEQVCTADCMGQFSVLDSLGEVLISGQLDQ